MCLSVCVLSICVCVYACTCAGVGACVYACVCVCASACVCMCVWAQKLRLYRNPKVTFSRSQENSCQMYLRMLCSAT